MTTDSDEPLARLAVAEKLVYEYRQVVAKEVCEKIAPELTAVQAILLARISEEGIPSKAITRDRHYIGTNATHNLKKLGEEGYLDKTEGADLRFKYLHLTPKGHTVKNAVIQALQKYADAS